MIAHVRCEHLTPDMDTRPDRAFIVGPNLYEVVDADTIKLTAKKAEWSRTRVSAFRIRFFNTAAPELPKKMPTDDALRAAGINPHENHPGEMARICLRRLVRNRALFVEPQMDDCGPKLDVFNRSLCRVFASGTPGPVFDLDGVFDVEAALYDAGRVEAPNGTDFLHTTPVDLETLISLAARPSLCAASQPLPPPPIL